MMGRILRLNVQDTVVASSGFGGGVLGFFPPDRNLRDCRKRDFPAPVSPVTTTKGCSRETEADSKSVKFSMRILMSILRAFQLKFVLSSGKKIIVFRVD